MWFHLHIGMRTLLKCIIKTYLRRLTANRELFPRKIIVRNTDKSIYYSISRTMWIYVWNLTVKLNKIWQLKIKWPSFIFLHCPVGYRSRLTILLCSERFGTLLKWSLLEYRMIQFFKKQSSKRRKFKRSKPPTRHCRFGNLLSPVKNVKLLKK